MTPMGYRFVGPPAMEDGSFEPRETALFRRLLGNADVVINVGANAGYYCCIALNEGKRVFAFEPLPENVQILLRNVKENSWEDRFELFPIALGDKPAIVTLFGSGTGASLIRGWANMPINHVCNVPMSTLELVMGQRLTGTRCLFVIDIEGGELSFLRGAEKVLLQDPRPVWMMEICIAEHQPAGVSINPHLLDTFEVFWSSGYTAFSVQESVRLIERREIEDIVRTGQDTLATHNFLFVDSTGSSARLFRTA